MLTLFCFMEKVMVQPLVAIAILRCNAGSLPSTPEMGTMTESPLLISGIIMSWVVGENNDCTDTFLGPRHRGLAWLHLQARFSRSDETNVVIVVKAITLPGQKPSEHGVLLEDCLVSLPSCWLVVVLSCFYFAPCLPAEATCPFSVCKMSCSSLGG